MCYRHNIAVCSPKKPEPEVDLPNINFCLLFSTFSKSVLTIIETSDRQENKLDVLNK